MRPGVRHLSLHIALEALVHRYLKRIVYGVGAILGAVERSQRQIPARVVGDAKRSESSEDLLTVGTDEGDGRIAVGLIEEVNALGAHIANLQNRGWEDF